MSYGQGASTCSTMALTRRCVRLPAGRLYNKNGLWEDSIPRIEQSLAYFLLKIWRWPVLANSPIGATGKFFRVWSLTPIWLIFNDGDRSHHKRLCEQLEQ